MNTQMKPYTPDEAHNLAADLLKFVPMMGEAVIAGAKRKEFVAIAARAQVLCEQPATAATCRDIEGCLGIIVNLFLDAPALHDKPHDQVQVLLDCFELAGSACHAAAGDAHAQDGLA
jgi:hypothetical protein